MLKCAATKNLAREPNELGDVLMAYVINKMKYIQFFQFLWEQFLKWNKKILQELLQ